jgi:hypothetical protein
VNIGRKIAALALVSLGVGIISFVFYNSDYASNKDFTSYWAAGHLLVHHSNPYSTATVLELERSVGYRADKPLIMRNAPYALPLALPLALVGVKTGAVVWSLFIVAALVVSVRLLWLMLGKPPDVHLFAYMFAPAASVMIFGQTSPLILLGLVLFLWLHKTRPLVAGMALALGFIKPQLVLPFGVALLIWIGVTRSYKIIAGLALSVGASLAIAVYFDHSLFSDYLPVLQDARGESAIMPTASGLLRMMLGQSAHWVQFVPAIAGCAWAAWYFIRHRNEWDWRAHGPLLLLVSIFVAPYSWFPDEIVVLPAIMLIIAKSATNRYLLALFALNGAALALLFSDLSAHNSALLLWTPAAWLMWYLWATADIRSATTARSLAWEWKKLKRPQAL